MVSQAPVFLKQSLKLGRFNGLMRFLCPSWTGSHPRVLLYPTSKSQVALANSKLQLFCTTASSLKNKPSKHPRQSQLEPGENLDGKQKDLDLQDFSGLEEGIAKAILRLKTELSTLRTGSRLDPTLVENVRVSLGKDGKTNVKLGDIAQVVPKSGRSMILMVGEKEHTNPIVSALLMSSLALQAQPSPSGNPLELQVPIPPPTQESRQATQVQASKDGENALGVVRIVRQKAHKRIQKIGGMPKIRADDVFKANKLMENIVEKGVVEIKKLVENAKKMAMG